MTTLHESASATTPGNYFVVQYPPRSHWKPEFIPKFLHALTAPPTHEPLGLYVRLPFCNQRCHFCNSHIYPMKSEVDVDLYIVSLLRELAIYQRYPGLELRPFSSVFLSGGTPSYLSSEQLRTLLGSLQDISPWNEVQECTFECEPATVTPPKLKVLLKYGVTRLSIGFQSLNNSVLHRNGRKTEVHECYRAFIQAREAGFREINVDLVAGLDGETHDSWHYTIDRILELQPDCVTIYPLELAVRSPLHTAIQVGRHVELPDWEEKRALIAYAFSTLERAGYHVATAYSAVRELEKWKFQYTVDHLWRGADILGLGKSAFGTVHGVHYQNVNSIEEYERELNRGRLPLRRAFRMRPDQRLRRELIFTLKTGVVDVAHFEKKHKVNLLDHFEAEFQQLIEQGLADIDRKKIRLTREGLLNVDAFLPIFFSREEGL